MLRPFPAFTPLARGTISGAYTQTYCMYLAGLQVTERQVIRLQGHVGISDTG